MLERLQKIISRAGIASRRHAEDLIRSGQVRVNGVVVTELGAKADPDHDRVEAAGQVAKVSDARVYLLMNKPPEVVSTLADPEGRRTLRNFLVGVSERVFPVGRLDYAAAGAVFLTNDGEFASRMLKASAALPQTYWVKVKGRLSETQLKSLAHMLHGKIFPLRAPHAAGKNAPNPWYEAQISDVRRDLLRSNLLAIGHPVEKLRRMKLASLDADSVPEGHYRQLTAPEIAKLVRAVDHALAQPKSALLAKSARRAWRPRRDVLQPGSKQTSGFTPAPGSKPNFASRPNSTARPNSGPKSKFGPRSNSGSGPNAGGRPSSGPKFNSGSKPTFGSKSNSRRRFSPGSKPKPRFKSPHR